MTGLLLSAAPPDWLAFCAACVRRMLSFRRGRHLMCAVLHSLRLASYVYSSAHLSLVVAAKKMILGPFELKRFIQSVHPSVLPSVHPSIRPSIRPSVRLSVRPSVHTLVGEEAIWAQTSHFLRFSLSAPAHGAATATWQPQQCCTACFGFRWCCTALIPSRWSCTAHVVVRWR